MSRRGSERKLPWSEVPEPVRREVARILGAPVARAERVYGGYAPSATYRMRLGDGRRAFFKGVHPGSSEHMRRAIAGEERIYRRLKRYLEPVTPTFLGAIHAAEWHCLLLEDLGPATVPPWTAPKARAATLGYARFHRSSVGRALPVWLPRRREREFAFYWRGLASSGEIDRTAALARRREAEAREWLDVCWPNLDRAARRIARSAPPYALLHFDTRSDNIRLQGERLRIFDWNFASVGAPEFDAAAFAQSIACEGGPAPEWLMSVYASVQPVRDAVVTSAIAAIAGYFADRAWRPPIEGLPRLRSIQRRQLKASLAWAARALDLPEPAWLRAVAD